MKLKILTTECDCEKCSFMCHAPCCGTPNDMKLLIEAGYGKRLMYDDLPGGEAMLKPALKGYEGRRSPWEVSSKQGCTFWKEKKCELHSLGLKPIQGKLAHHSLNKSENDEIGDYINESWEDEKGNEVIEKWRKINNDK